MSEHNIVGKIGEETACLFLTKHKFSIIDRNYTKKWGEIDIIVKKDNIIHFVEVKTVSCPSSYFDDSNEHKNVSYETFSKIRPEEMVHISKQRRIARTIQTYFDEYVARETSSDIPDWRFDVIAVFIDNKKEKAHIRFTQNIILS